MFEYLENKRVLVSGGAGSVGHALAEAFKKIPGLKHFVMSRNEASQFKLQQAHPHIICKWGDVTNKLDVEKIFYEIKPDVVIHAAAVKVVPTAEKEMLKTFETNAMGTYNIAMACLAHNVEVALTIGTDKQCSPINIYGMTKHIGTSIFSDCNRLGKTRFISVRYGNVLCSRSSLGVIVMEQALAGKELTVTDPTMTRFFFTIQEGVRLINIALERAYFNYDNVVYGETISTQMCSVILKDFFELISEDYNVPIKIIGRRPGEKTHEHLMADYELKDTYMEQSLGYSPFYAQKHILYPYVTTPHLFECGRKGSYLAAREFAKEIFTSENAPKLSKKEIRLILDYAWQNTFKD